MSTLCCFGIVILPYSILPDLKNGQHLQTILPAFVEEPPFHAIPKKMIWGKTLDPGKLYTEVVHTDIHLSMAALESRGNRGAEYNGYTQVMLKTGGDEFLLCTLVHGMIFQQTLDVQLKKGEEISVYAEGKNKVHLTGYSVCIEERLVNSVSGIRAASSGHDGTVVHSDSDSVVSSQDGNSFPVIKTEYQEAEVEECWQSSRAGTFTVAPLPCGTTDLMRWVELRNRSMVGKDRLATYGPRMEGAHDARRLNSFSASHQRSNKNQENDVSNHSSVAGTRQTLNQDSDDDVSSVSDDERQPTSGREELNQNQIPAHSQLNLPVITQNTSIAGSASHLSTEDAMKSLDLPTHASYQKISEPIATSQMLKLQTALIQKSPPQEFSNSEEGVALPIPTPVRGYQCQFCFKLFRHVSNFKSHQLIHTNLKPYKCRFCGVGFKQTGNLKAHERIHTGDRPYKCSYCGKQFARSTTRNTHEKLHTNSVTYRCKVCDRIFMHANSLKKHQMLHKT